MLTTEQLLDRMKVPEDSLTERKSKGVAPDELRRTLCAFANSVQSGQYATLFIGIHDSSGEITGVDDTDTLQKTLRKAATVTCYPPISYESRVIVVDGKNVLAVIVPPSSRRPHFTGPAFVRVGSESVQANEEQLDRFVTLRVDKAAAILALCGRVVRVKGLAQPPGAPLEADGTRECRIDGCDAHRVHFSVVASGTRYTEPLALVHLSFDHARHRDMLVITSAR